MKKLQPLGRLALLWLVLSVIGVLAPVWLLGAFVYLKLRPLASRLLAWWSMRRLGIKGGSYGLSGYSVRSG